MLTGTKESGYSAIGKTFALVWKVEISRFSSPTSSTSRFHDNRLRKEERDLDVDEENWFNDDGDDNRITSLNREPLFNNNSDDDDDSQPEITSAISTSEPPRPRQSSSDDEDEDDEGVLTFSRSPPQKPTISIHIGRSSTSGEMSAESSYPYARVRTTTKTSLERSFCFHRVRLCRILLINITMRKRKTQTVNPIR